MRGMQKNSKRRTSIRRRQARVPTRVFALARARNRHQTVLVVDYSESGAQLQGSYGLFVGDGITLELLSGDVVPAKVSWSLNDRVGIEFVDALRPEHPVQYALQRAAERRRAVSQDPAPAAGERAAG